MAARTREKTIERIAEILARAGFFVSDAHAVRPSSFDLMARRDSTLLIVKVLKNIDALDPTEAAQLRRLGALFQASPIVVGEMSGGTKLTPGVVYTRYDLPVLVEDSLEEYVLRGVPPFLFASPGGIFARIDGERLRAVRESRGLSLGALASVAGVSRRTIQLYEEGAGAEVAVVERIEHYLTEPIVRPIELFVLRRTAATKAGAERTPAEGASPPDEPKTRPDPPSPGPALASTGDPIRDRVLRQLDDMGWQVTVTVRCPFDALSQGSVRKAEELLLTSVGSLRTAKLRAELLHDLARVAEGHALYVLREAGEGTSIDGLPVVTVPELKRHRDRDELLELIFERESS
jgi:putative transcriptional regulator